MDNPLECPDCGSTREAILVFGMSKFGSQFVVTTEGVGICEIDAGLLNIMSEKEKKPNIVRYFWPWDELDKMHQEVIAAQAAPVS